MTRSIPRGPVRGGWFVGLAVTLLILTAGAPLPAAARPGIPDGQLLPPAPAASEAPPGARPKEFDYTAFNTFLAKYLKGGLIDYAALKKDGGKDLDAMVEAMSRFPYRGVFLKEARVAFLINAHNAIAIQQALKAYPPARAEGGPKEIPGFFDKTTHALDGGKFTLDQIETELLAPISPREPRFHLALCRAAMGAPPLRAHAFTADSLGLQLEDLATRYAQNRSLVRVSAGSDTLFLPEVFEWHRKDFEWGDQTLPRYMAPNFGLGPMMKMLQNEPIVVFGPFDWRLNDIRNAGSSR